MKSKKARGLTWEEQKARERRVKNIKAAVIAVLLLAGSVTTMAVLWEWEIRAFNVFLWIFGVIGFVRVMLLLVTWISDITITQPEDNQGWYEQL